MAFAAKKNFTTFTCCQHSRSTSIAVCNLPVNKKIFLDSPFGSEKSRNSSKVTVQCLLQNFTSCCIARDLVMLHIKMFISNAAQKIIQANKMTNFVGHVQIKQATNSLTSVQHAKWTRSAKSLASLLSTFCYPRKNLVPPSDSLSRLSPLSSEFRIFNPLP